LPVILGVLALIGIVLGPVNPLMVTIRHERIPPPMRGRVFASYSAISQLVSPLGIVVGGFAIAGFGLTPTAIALAVAANTLWLAMFFVPSLRGMNGAA